MLAKLRAPFFFVLALMVFGTCIGTTQTKDQSQVIRTTVSAVLGRFPHSTVMPSVSEVAVVGNYALTTWLFGEGGGQAVLQKKNSGTWYVIAIGGGEMDSSTLVAFGVPSATATSLERKLAAVATPNE